MLTERPQRQADTIESPLGTTTYTVQNEFEFLRDFVSEINKARERVGIKCMTLHDGHAPGLILRAVEKAYARGASAKIIKDNHSGKLEERVNRTQAELDYRRFSLLSCAGVDIKETKPAKGLFPKLPVIGKYSQRDHRKIYFADDTVWIGGMNLGNENFNNIDFMVKIKEPKVVQEFISIFEKEYQPPSDYELSPNKETRILVDVGNRGKSLILDEAVKLVDSAKSYVQIFSMLLPDGKFLKALKSAKKREVKVDIISSKNGELKVPLSRMVQSASRLRYKTVHEKDLPIHTAKKFVLAKYLGVDGKQVLFGSHNFSGQGVFLGTAEMSMISSNPILVVQIENFFQEEFKKAQNSPAILETLSLSGAERPESAISPE